MHSSYRNQSRWSYLLQLVLIIGLILTFISIMSVGEAVNGGPAAKVFLVSRVVLLLLICTWFLRRSGQSWKDVGLRRPPRWWSIPLLTAGGLIAMLAASVLISQIVIPAIGWELPQLKPKEFASDQSEFLFFLVAIGWGSAAFGEAMLLRGFFIDRLRRIMGSDGRGAIFAAILLQGVLFGLFHIHQGPGGVLMTGTLGIMFGLIWYAGGRNLWACILIHGLINTISDIEAYQAVAAPPSIEGMQRAAE